jgi:hypothetical protein
MIVYLEPPSGQQYVTGQITSTGLPYSQPNEPTHKGKSYYIAKFPWGKICYIAIFPMARGKGYYTTPVPIRISNSFKAKKDIVSEELEHLFYVEWAPSRLS